MSPLTLKLKSFMLFIPNHHHHIYRKSLNFSINFSLLSSVLLLLSLSSFHYVNCSSEVSNVYDTNVDFDQQSTATTPASTNSQSNETGYFSDLWNTLTTTNKTLSCPGECVHAITSIFCDHVLEDINCGGNLFRCCVSNSQYEKLFVTNNNQQQSPSTTVSNTEISDSSSSPAITMTTMMTNEIFSVISNNHYHHQNQQSTDETIITTTTTTTTTTPIPTMKTSSSTINQETSLFYNDDNIYNRNNYENRDDNKSNFDNDQQQQIQNSSIKTNPCPVQCMSLRNTFCVRPLHDAYCMNQDEECCLESESTFDAMTKDFIKLIQQTVAMNQTKNIGSEFQHHSPSSTVSPATMISSSTPSSPMTAITTTISSLPPCDGTCVVPLFHMLCDEIDHNQYCSHGYCCVNRDTISTTASPIIQQCDGTCLPVILSGMCTKPSELVLKTLDCNAGTICCARGNNNKYDQDININNQPQIIPAYPPNQLSNIPPRIPIPPPFRKNTNNQFENVNNKVHFRPPDILPPQIVAPAPPLPTPANDENFPPAPLNNEPNLFVCPGKCINSMFKFTCLGGYSISKQFKCSTKGQLCCASNADIEKLEMFLRNTMLVQQQPQQPISISQPSKPIIPTQSLVPQPILPSTNDNNQQPIVPPIQPLAPALIDTKPIVTSIQPLAPSLIDAKPIIQQQQPQIPQPVSMPSSTTYHQCGVKGSKRTQRVVGGKDSYPGEWCWQIAIVNQQNKYICGGVLIGKQWALTAAHCVTHYLRKNEAIYIRAGEFDLKRSNRYGQRQKIQTIFVHHNHNSQSLDNDIALMKLISPIELNPNTCLICLPTWNSIDNNQNNQNYFRDKQCTVTGYGFQHESGPIALRIREAMIPIVDDHECIRKINSVTEKQFMLPASSFCAGGGHGGNDACQGDGGSGLVCETSDNYYELTGLVSWGFGCGRNGVPGVYVKVISFIGWINQIVSTNS